MKINVLFFRYSHSYNNKYAKFEDKGNKKPRLEADFEADWLKKVIVVQSGEDLAIKLGKCYFDLHAYDIAPNFSPSNSRELDDYNRFETIRDIGKEMLFFHNSLNLTVNNKVFMQLSFQNISEEDGILKFTCCYGYYDEDCDAEDSINYLRLFDAKLWMDEGKVQVNDDKIYELMTEEEVPHGKFVKKFSFLKQSGKNIAK